MPQKAQRSARNEKSRACLEAYPVKLGTAAARGAAEAEVRLDKSAMLEPMQRPPIKSCQYGTHDRPP